MAKPDNTAPLKLGARVGWGSREGPVTLNLLPQLGEGRKESWWPAQGGRGRVELPRLFPFRFLHGLLS